VKHPSTEKRAEEPPSKVQVPLMVKLLCFLLMVRPSDVSADELKRYEPVAALLVPLLVVVLVLGLVIAFIR
jgi:hypothetical protein